ncbi:hypothetical protein H8D57_04075 [bacterium]|nr:hypothetical protein [bacterium]
MQRIFESFAELLDERLSLGVFTTEDSVRYTFFQALTQDGDLHHTDVIMEYPHPEIKRAQIDTLITAKGSLPSMAFEFKYDRRNPGKTNQNRTQRAGAVFKDLFRLTQVPDKTAKKKYFVYLTDDEMAGYFRNPANGFARFFELDSGESFSIDNSLISTRARTFQDVVHSYQIESKAIGAFRSKLSQDHALRIFSIQSL